MVAGAITTIGGEQVDRALAVARSALATPSPALPVVMPQDRGPKPGRELLRQAEHDELRAALSAHKGSRAELARHLGISERSLYRKLRALEEGRGLSNVRAKIESNKTKKNATRRWCISLILWLPDLGSNQGPTD